MPLAGDPNATPPRIWLKPPIAMLLLIILGAVIEVVIPTNEEAFLFNPETLVLGVILIAFALFIIITAVRELHRARATLRIGEKINSLVTTGIFNRSRNPIYLGFVLFTAGIGVACASPWIIGGAIALLIYLQELVIKREERYLTARFGEQYLAYKHAVRRWF